jgi:hypothetical protein
MKFINNVFTVIENISQNLSILHSVNATKATISLGILFELWLG